MQEQQKKIEKKKKRSTRTAATNGIFMDLTVIGF